MKKTLIALAALAATASFAQSSVTIKGTFDPSFVSQKDTYGNGSSVTNTGLQNNRQGTSQVTFLGTEDLGGGLKASFLIENDFDATKDATGNFASKGGELYAGLSGGFGSIKVGAPNTPTLYAQLLANPFGTKIGSGFGSMNTAHVRNNNSMVYASPSFGGVTVSVGYSNKAKDSTGAVSTAANTDLGLSYANGPLAAGITSYTADGLAGVADTKQTNAYVTYDMGVAKLGAGSYTEKKTGSIDSAAYNLSVSMPMGAVTLMANIAKKNDKMLANKDRTVTAVGVKYDLSKRTSLYGRLATDKIDNETTAANVAKSSYTLVGMQHNF